MSLEPSHSIFHEVIHSLAHEHPLEQTLDLISQRAADVGGFSFCGVLLPDAERRTIHLAGGHGFPPRYADRLDEVFLVPVGDQALLGSPTRTAVQEARTAVMGDVLSDEGFRPWRALALEFGYRSLVSVPLLVEGQVIGVLNGYSDRPREYTRDEIAAVETLAAQAAIALRLTMLVESRQETIDTLERAHEIHLRLTTAVIEGANFQAVAQTLAELIGRGVTVTDPRGRVLCTSDPAPDADGPALVADIRIGPELLGRVRVLEGDRASHDLDLRAVEHGATVLALEIVRERAAREAEQRLRADFLADLLSGRHEAEERMVERARHYGLSLGAPHRVLVIAVDDWAQAGGRSRRGEVLRVIAGIVGERTPGSLATPAGDTLALAVPIDGLDDPAAALTRIVEEVRRRLAPRAPGLTLTAGIGGPAASAAEFPESHRKALQCVELLGRLGRAGTTLATDDLGILSLFVDGRSPAELQQLAEQVLGPMVAHDAQSGGALRETLTAYLDLGCDVRSCAQALYVHANTVKYRLRRIEELCALNLRDPNDLLRATIAMLVLRIV